METHSSSSKYGAKGLGREGEILAESYLQSQGYQVIERNFRIRTGEVDLIAWEGRTICFIEVKTRRSLEKGSGLEAISEQKKHRISQAAQFFLQEKGWDHKPARFDVLAIFIGDASSPECDLIKDAFEVT
jgi:putative endonuclease